MPRFGLWGGRPPGGWCTFKTASTTAPSGYGYQGTREEAEAGAAQFAFEREESVRKYGPRNKLAYAYDAVEFDPLREPEAVVGKPTTTQAKFLRALDETGDFNRVVWEHPQWRAASRALHDKGWTFYDATTGKTRLTAAGRAALARH